METLTAAVAAGILMLSLLAVTVLKSFLLRLSRRLGKIKKGGRNGVQDNS